VADSIPSLRRRLAEAQAKIAELEARKPAGVVKEVRVEVPVDRVVYRDRVVPQEVERVVYRDRVVTEQLPPVVEKEYIHVPVDREVVRYETIETVREVYVTDPVQEQTIRELQERLREWQSTSA